MPEKKYAIKLQWVEELVKCLKQHPVPELQRYLRQFNLPTFGTQSFLIDRIIDAALVSEKLKKNGQTGLGGRFPMPVGAQLTSLNTQIGNLLKKGEKVPDFEELMNYTDEFAENGRQYIFFYRINSDHMKYLHYLRNEDYIYKLLKKNKYGRYYNKKHSVWYARTPKLSEVRHWYNKGEGKSKGEGELIFKWVEARNWNQKIGASLPPQFIRRQERSVNFFRLDLKNGITEIRIQKLETFPQKRLSQELKIYINEVKKLLNFDYFSPVPVEPIIRRLLRSSVIRIRSWSIKLPTGGILIGVKEPNLFNRLRFSFGNYSALKISGDWINSDREWGPQNVLTELDVNMDKLLITKYCDRQQIGYILRWLKSVILEQIKSPLPEPTLVWINTPEIRKLIKKRKDLEPILRNIDQVLLKSKDKKVSSGQIDRRYSSEFIEDTFKELVNISPKEFKISRQKRKAVLVYKPIKGLIGFLEYVLGTEFSVAQKGAIISLLFMVVIIFLFWLNIKLFLPFLMESYGKSGDIIITLTCLINIICIFAIVIPVIGIAKIRYAIGLIEKIIKLKEIFHFRGKSSPNNHRISKPRLAK